jgi:hypothetical protein
MPKHDLTGGSTWMPKVLKTLYDDNDIKTALDDSVARAKSMLEKAATFDAAGPTPKTKQDGKNLIVRITNRTGHKLPTGYPEGRRMWLNVKFYKKYVGPNDASNEVIAESGHYKTDVSVNDDGYGEIVADSKDPACTLPLKVYEVELGLDQALGGALNRPVEKGFHFAINNKVYKDNRIPPAGFANASFDQFGGKPIDPAHRDQYQHKPDGQPDQWLRYIDGNNWDETTFPIPVGTVKAEVSLLYQTASPVYIKFLRDKNPKPSPNAGTRMYALWDSNMRCPPETMLNTLLDIQTKRIHVDPDAPGNNDGTTWFDAFTDLQAALAAAAASSVPTEVWVAEGTYKPTAGASRSATFLLPQGVQVYGGFQGVTPAPGGLPDGETSLGQRNVAANMTILTGDLAGDDGANFANNAENVYHVVTGAGDGICTGTGHTLLDGFTITGGNADGQSLDNIGGGLTNISTTGLTVANCTFVNNSSTAGGGGYYGNAATQQIVNCAFKNNHSNGGGGGVRIIGDALLMNCVLTGNDSDTFGGGIYAVSATAAITNCSLKGNTADLEGGGIHSNASALTVVSTILWGNSDIFGNGASSQLAVDGNAPTVRYSCIQDNAAGDGTAPFGGAANGNIDKDPSFSDAALRLAASSPCIDAGDNAAVPADVADLNADADRVETTPLDADLAARFADDPTVIDTGNPFGARPMVDMGAYEYQPPDGICGDLNLDEAVDAVDFDIFLSAFGHNDTEAEYIFAADFDGDLLITFVDYQYWIECYRAFLNMPLAPAPLWVLGDFNLDAQINAVDLSHMADCATGPALGPPAPPCSDADLDFDGDVDQRDFAMFQRCLTPAGASLDLTCKH